MYIDDTGEHNICCLRFHTYTLDYLRCADSSSDFIFRLTCEVFEILSFTVLLLNPYYIQCKTV